MSHAATERLRLQPAPDGLALVQDLLNTRSIGGKVPDLLTGVDQASGWLTDALASWTDVDHQSSPPELSKSDLAGLRILRGELQRLVGAGETITTSGTVATVGLSIQPSGQLRLEPTGTGLQRFASEVWAEVFLAQRADTWKRLKLCHLAACSSAFYDRSKNNSGVWHDVKMCGNAANLRASRARRRELDAVGTGRAVV